jgi:hypothetical protein
MENFSHTTGRTPRQPLEDNTLCAVSGGFVKDCCHRGNSYEPVIPSLYLKESMEAYGQLTSMRIDVEEIRDGVVHVTRP